MQPRLSRRTALKATGSLGLGIATGSILAGNAAAGDHTFAKELDTVRATTRRYHDVETARENGYSFFGVFDFVGVVYANRSNINNIGHTEDPSLLFYAPNRSGDTEDSDLILAGIEYHVTPRGAGDQDIFADEEASRKVEVPEAHGWHSNPDPEVNLTGLHVWVHLRNPEGVFALEHSTIRDRLTE